MTQDESPDDAQFRLSLLRHYLSTADEKCARIRAALAETRESPESKPAVESLGRSLHTLAGNAGTYGFPQLSVRARELSKKVRAESTLPSALGVEIERFCEEMLTAFNQAKAALPPEAPSITTSAAT